MNRPLSHPLPTTGGFNKAASDASYADALAEIRNEAQARYLRDYGHTCGLYSEKGPFR